MTIIPLEDLAKQLCGRLITCSDCPGYDYCIINAYAGAANGLIKWMKEVCADDSDIL